MFYLYEQKMLRYADPGVQMGGLPVARVAVRDFEIEWFVCCDSVRWMSQTQQ